MNLVECMSFATDCNFYYTVKQSGDNLTCDLNLERCHFTANSTACVDYNSQSLLFPVQVGVVVVLEGFGWIVEAEFLVKSINLLDICRL